MRSRTAWYVALLGLTALVLVAGTASAQAGEDPDPGGVFADHSGNGHNLTTTGDPQSGDTAAPDKFSPGVVFDGDDFADVVDSAFAETGDMAVLVSFLVDSLPSDGVSPIAQTFDETEGPLGSLEVDNNGQIVYNTNGDSAINTGTDIVTGNHHTLWFHRSGTTVTIELDGTQIAQTGRELPAQSDTVHATIAGDFAGVNTLTGRLYEARFWTDSANQPTIDELQRIADQNNTDFDSKLQGDETAFYMLEDVDGAGDGDGGAPQTGAGRNQVHLEPDYGRVLEANESFQLRAWGAGGNGSFASHIGNQSPRAGIYATANTDGTSSQQGTHLACWDSTNRTWVQHNDTGPLAPSACQHALFDTLNGSESMGVVNLTGPHVPVLDGDEHPGVTFWVEGWVFNSSLLDANVTAAASSPALIEGSQAQASTLSNTAFHEFSGLTSLEWGLFFLIAFLGVILWARTQDLVVEVLGAMLPVLAGLLLLGFGIDQEFSSIWLGIPAMSAIFMLAGIYMMIRVFTDKLGREEGGGLRG